MGALRTIVIDGIDHYGSIGKLQGGFERVSKPPENLRAHHQAVNNDLDIVLLGLLQTGRIGQGHNGSIDPRPREALRVERAQ